MTEENQENDALTEMRRLLVEGKENLEKTDERMHGFLAQHPNNADLAFFYNEFRIGNLSRLPRWRPQILLSGVLNVNYPNLHSENLFRVADVICLCSHARYTYMSTLICSPDTLFFDILQRLPKEFKPDFYWDNQVEQGHYIPPGIEIAPFPIVASICHSYLHKSIEHVCEIFDRILPPSTYYDNILKKRYPEKILDFPFGLNWASFHSFIMPCWEKTIDVCVIFAENQSPVYAGKRNQVIAWARKFKEKYGNRFSVVVTGDLPKVNYIEMLKQSRVTVNVTGVHGPYNYRTVEAICAGFMLFHYDWDDAIFQNHFSELFTDGVHGVGFTEATFESKLLYYLENPAAVEKIARTAYQFLVENFSYPTLYKRLIQEVKAAAIELPRTGVSKRGYFHRDMVYYNQNNSMKKLMNFGVLAAFELPPWIRWNNLMLYSQTLEVTNAGLLMLVAMSVESLVHIQNSDFWSLGLLFHDLALSAAPQEHAWIVQWNFFLLSFEANKVSKTEIAEMIEVLEKTSPMPFDEMLVMFKYEASKRGYPDYTKPEEPSDLRHLFIQLNIDLLKAIDDPHQRACLHHAYALQMARYLLSKLESN